MTANLASYVPGTGGPGPELVPSNGSTPVYLADPNYDSATVRVDPQTVDDCAIVLQSAAQEMVNLLEDINTTLSNLALGWAGQTADEAQEMNNAWTTVMTDLFGSSDQSHGTPDAAAEGVIGVMLSGLTMVAAGFSQAEMGLVKMFQDFYSSLTSGSSDTTTPTSAPQSVTDPTNTAVTEVFP